MFGVNSKRIVGRLIRQIVQMVSIAIDFKVPRHLCRMCFFVADSNLSLISRVI